MKISMNLRDFQFIKTSGFQTSGLFSVFPIFPVSYLCLLLTALEVSSCGYCREQRREQSQLLRNSHQNELK